MSTLPLGVWGEAVVSCLVILGATFVLLGAVGLIRLPDTLSRLHAPTKACTLGIGALLLASAVYFSLASDGVSLREAAVLVFLFLTAPVTAQLLAKAALHRRLPRSSCRPTEKTAGFDKQDQRQSLNG